MDLIKREKPSPQEIALARYRLIAPLLEPEMEEAERRRRRKEILAKTTCSERTIRRYVEDFTLKPE